MIRETFSIFYSSALDSVSRLSLRIKLLVIPLDSFGIFEYLRAHFYSDANVIEKIISKIILKI